MDNKYDTLLSNLSSEDANDFLSTLSDEQRRAYYLSFDKPSEELYSTDEDFAEVYRTLPAKTRSEYKDFVLRKLESWFNKERKASETNTPRSEYLATLQSDLNSVRGLGARYEDMNEYQKYLAGKEYGLNWYSPKDQAKVESELKRTQDIKDRKRKFEQEEAEHPWLTMLDEIINPSTTASAKRGEEPDTIDWFLDKANQVSLVATLGAPGIAKVGAKIVSKLTPKFGPNIATKIANSFKARALKTLSDIGTNTAITTAIDQRNMHEENEDFGTKNLGKNTAKNLGVSTGMTLGTGILTAKAVPKLLGQMAGRYGSDLGTKVEQALAKYFTNPALEARALTKTGTGIDQLTYRARKYLDEAIEKGELTLSDDMLNYFGKWGFDENDIRALYTQYATELGRLKALPDGHTATGILQDASKFHTTGPESPKELVKNPTIKKVKQAEDQVARMRGLHGDDRLDYGKVYSTPLGATISEYGVLPVIKTGTRAGAYGRNRPDDELAPYRIYNDEEYRKYRAMKENQPYKVVFLPEKFKNLNDAHGEKYGIVFGD